MYRIFYLFIDSKVKFSSTKNKILRFDLTIMLPCSLRCKFMYKHNTDRYVIFFLYVGIWGDMFSDMKICCKIIYLFHLLLWTLWYIRRVLNWWKWKLSGKLFFFFRFFRNSLRLIYDRKFNRWSYNKIYVIRKEPQRNYSIKTYLSNQPTQSLWVPDLWF